jgi:hypothetical protein
LTHDARAARAERMPQGDLCSTRCRTRVDQRANVRARVSPGSNRVPVPNLWIAAVGPGYFEMFDRPILSGRDFHGGDLAPGARSVVVNEVEPARRALRINPMEALKEA